MMLSVTRDASLELVAICRTSEGDRELTRAMPAARGADERKKFIRGGKIFCFVFCFSTIFYVLSDSWLGFFFFLFFRCFVYLSFPLLFCL